MKHFLFFFITILFSVLAQANCRKLVGNVVFFDFNESPEEIVGAKKVAAEKCQNFRSVRSEGEARKVLADIEKSGEDVSSLIMSGHHRFGVFWGKNFKMTIGGISDLIEEFPKTKSSVKNLFLWGCYTNNIDKLERWLKSFPNLDYVYGFSHKSPLSHQVTGVDYLQKAMRMQDELAKNDSLEKVKTFLDKAIPGSPNFHFVSAAIYGKAKCDPANYKDFYYSIDHIENGTKSSIDHFTDKSQCDGAKKTFEKSYASMLKSYWTGEKEILSLSDPESKIAAKNPIRIDLYPWANKFSFCFNKSTFKTGTGQEIGLGHMLNLVYFQNIKAHFFKYFSSDTDGVKSALGQHPEILAQLNKGSQLTRKEVIELELALSRINPQTQILQAYAFKLKAFLVNLDDRCVDVNWLEDVKDIQKPPSFCTSPR